MTTRTKPLLRSCPVVIGKEVTSFGATDLERIAFSQPRNLAGRFPNLISILPAAADAYATVEIDPTILANVLTTIAKIGTTDEMKRVTLELHQPKGHRGRDCMAPICIRTVGQTPLQCTALVVPLTMPKKKPQDIDEAPAAMTDDDKRMHGQQLLIDELRRQLTAAQDAAAYHRNNVEELRAELAESKANAITAVVEDTKAICNELVQDERRQKAKAYAEMDRQRVALEDIAAKVRPFAKQSGTVAHAVHEIARDF